MYFFNKKYLLFVTICFLFNLTYSQKIYLSDIINHWENSQIDSIEGLYVELNDTVNPEIYGIIKSNNGHKLIHLISDTIFEPNGTLRQYEQNSYLTDIVFNNKNYYNIEIKFDENHNYFFINIQSNIDFVKIVPSNSNTDNSEHENNYEIDINITNSGLLEVPVVINGVLRIYFIIDSGASETQISPDVALTLLRSKTISDDDWLDGRTYVFANGESAYSKRFLLKSLKIGGVVLYNIAVSISNNLEAPMLLGQNVLQLFGDYKIDYKKSKLIIHPQ